MNEGFNFFDLGMRYADEKYRELKRRPKDIEEENGVSARIDFERGVSQFKDLYSEEESVDITVDSLFDATGNIGVPNLRNNSYFGSPGISSKYTTDGCNLVYVDPVTNGKGK